MQIAKRNLFWVECDDERGERESNDGVSEEKLIMRWGETCCNRKRKTLIMYQIINLNNEYR